MADRSRRSPAISATPQYYGALQVSGIGAYPDKNVRKLQHFREKRRYGLLASILVDKRLYRLPVTAAHNIAVADIAGQRPRTVCHI